MGGIERLQEVLVQSQSNLTSTIPIAGQFAFRTVYRAHRF